MPGPCPDHCPRDGGGGGLLIIGGVVVAIAGGIAAAVEWLAAHVALIEIILYGAVGLCVLGGVGLVAAVLCRDGHRVVLHWDPDAAAAARPRAIEAAPARPRPTEAAPVHVNVTVNVAAAPAAAAPQYHTHNHLHLHGVRGLLGALPAGWRKGATAMDGAAPVEAIEAPQARVLPGRVEARPLVPVERREVE